jgi:hypothetical protein
MTDNDDELSGGGSPAAALDAFDFDADFKEILAEVDPSLPFYADMGEEADASIGDYPEKPTDEDTAAAISGGRSDASSSRGGRGSWVGRGRGNGGLANEGGGGFEFGSGGTPLGGPTLKELVHRVIGPGTVNRETNALCAQILNHPEVMNLTGVLPHYPSYNGELCNKCFLYTSYPTLHIFKDPPAGAGGCGYTHFPG